MKEISENAKEKSGEKEYSNEINSQISTENSYTSEIISEVTISLTPDKNSESMDFGTIKLKDNLRYNKIKRIAELSVLNEETLFSSRILEALKEFDSHYYELHTECLSPSTYSSAMSSAKELPRPTIKDEGLFRNTDIKETTKGKKTKYHMDDQTETPSLEEVKSSLDNSLKELEKELNTAFKDTGISWSLQLILTPDLYTDVQISDFWTEKSCPCKFNSIGIPTKFIYEFYSHYDHVYITAPIIKITLTDKKYRNYEYNSDEYKPLNFTYYIQLRIEDDYAKNHDSTETPGTKNKNGNRKSPKQKAYDIKSKPEEVFSEIIPELKNKK